MVRIPTKTEWLVGDPLGAGGSGENFFWKRKGLFRLRGWSEFIFRNSRDQLEFLQEQEGLVRILGLL